MIQGLPSRLKLVVDFAAASAREVDRLAGLTTGHTQAIISGRKPGLAAATIAAHAVILGFSLDWMILNRGSGPKRDAVRAAVARARLDPEATRAATKAAVDLALGVTRGSNLRARRRRAKSLARPRPRPLPAGPSLPRASASPEVRP